MVSGRCRALFLVATWSVMPCLSVVAQDAPACLSYWVAPGQVTVTPARITSAPKKKVELRSFHPAGAEQSWRYTPPGQAYLFSGDRVDLVARCAGYSYVRFHGPRRVSTGWV